METRIAASAKPHKEWGGAGRTGDVGVAIGVRPPESQGRWSSVGGPRWMGAARAWSTALTFPAFRLLLT